jgi:hypothetical protein
MSRRWLTFRMGRLGSRPAHSAPGKSEARSRPTTQKDEGCKGPCLVDAGFARWKNFFSVVLGAVGSSAIAPRRRNRRRILRNRFLCWRLLCLRRNFRVDVPLVARRRWRKSFGHPGTDPAPRRVGRSSASSAGRTAWGRSTYKAGTVQRKRYTGRSRSNTTAHLSIDLAPVDGGSPGKLYVTTLASVVGGAAFVCGNSQTRRRRRTDCQASRPRRRYRMRNGLQPVHPVRTRRSSLVRASCIGRPGRTTWCRRRPSAPCPSRTCARRPGRSRHSDPGAGYCRWGESSTWKISDCEAVFAGRPSKRRARETPP